MSKSDVENMLTQGEQIILIAQQSRFKPGGSKLTPNTVFVTNQRVIFRNPKMLGLKKDYVEVYHRDVNKIELKKGVFSTEIHVFSRFQNKPIEIPAVDKGDAERIGGLIRQGMSGELAGQQIAQQSTSPVVIEKKAIEPIEQLKELAKLRDSGVLTNEEFEKKKQDILSRM